MNRMVVFPKFTAFLQHKEIFTLNCEHFIHRSRDACTARALTVGTVRAVRHCVRLCESSDSPTTRDSITTLTYYVVCAQGNRVMAQDLWFPHTHVLLVRLCLPVLLYATAIATAGQPSQSCRTQILSPISSPSSQ